MGEGKKLPGKVTLLLPRVLETAGKSYLVVIESVRNCREKLPCCYREC